jgi:lysylphosphatidylglycerol synthetase-like protein (DUF2156 family)
LEDAVPNLPLLSILVVLIAVFYATFSCIPIMNSRGDEALAGVVKGMPVSLKTRRLLLFTNYLPLCAFLASFTLVAGLGIIELARTMEEPRIQAIGYMAAIVCISGAVVFVGLGGAWCLHIWSVLRETKRD